MPWHAYLDILRRRWWIVALVLVADLLVSGYQFAHASRNAGYQGCVSLYVADVSAPSLISAPSATLDTAGALLAGETAANFFADDILDVAASQHVAAYVARSLSSRRLPTTALADINGAVGGSRRDRTVQLCATNSNRASALAIARQVGIAMTVRRAEFLGTAIAKRTYVTVISDASVDRVPAGRRLLNLGLEVILGALVALGLALLWDAVDPTIRGRDDVSQSLGVPVIRVPR